MLALVVRFELSDHASADAFDRLVGVTVRGVAEHEPDTLVYATHTVEGAPLSRVFYEVYRDRAAFEAHERQPHTVRFLRERGQYLTATRVEFITPSDNAKGLPRYA